MARLFGALANAGAQMRERQFQREQYDAQQEAARRAEQRRVFEFAATQERLKEQAQLQAQLRQDQLAWQKQQRKIAMINQGYQPWEGAGVDPMVGDQPYETDVRGIKVAAERVPNQQVTIDGERYFRNTQRERNAAAQKLATDLFAKFATLDDAQQARLQLQAAINAGRPQPQPKMDLWTDGKGGYLRLGMDDPIPPGYSPVRGSGGAQQAPSGPKNPVVKELWGNYRKEEPVKTAMTVAGPIRSINAALEQGLREGNRSAMLSAIYQVAKLNDPRTGVRPSELNLVGETAGLDERIRRTIDKWNSGKMLTPDMIRDIQGFVAEQQSSASNAVKPVQAQYGQMLRQSGLEGDSAYVAPSPAFGQGATTAHQAVARRPLSQVLQEEGKR